MSDFIDTITSLMPTSSNFAASDVQQILDETLGEYFDSKEKDIEDINNAHFLSEANESFLDLIHGKLYGISRNEDESDEDYRNRLIFQAKEGLKINDLKELGCDVYAYVENFNPENTLTSRNTKLTRKIMIDCPNDSVEELIKDNFIWEKSVVFL